MHSNADGLGISHEVCGDQEVLVIEGDIDLVSARHLEGKIGEFVDDGEPRRVIFDLSRVEFIDSSGLRVLMTMDRALRERGGGCALRSPSLVVQRLLTVTGLSDHLPIEGQ